MTWLSVAAVSLLGVSPAMAADPISAYHGSAMGRAVNLTASPDAALEVSLAQLQDFINQLPLGLDTTVNKTVGSTLQNPTGHIQVAIDGATADANSTNGQDLTGGSTATSTPLYVDATALTDEISLVNAALRKLPSGTVAALTAALAPIVKNDPSGTVQTSLTALRDAIDPITRLLGSPTVGPVTQTLSAAFPQDLSAQFAAVNQGGILTASAPFAQDAYHARAILPLAFADTSLTSVQLAPGLLDGLQITQAHLVAALDALRAALVAEENALILAAHGVPAVGTGVANQLGTVTTVINGTVDDQVTTAVGKADVLNKINLIFNTVSLLEAQLGQLNRLQLNNILGTGPSTALASIQRTGTTVSANGRGQAARIDAVKLLNPLLLSVLQGDGLRSLANTDLFTVDGVSGTAAVTLDGIHVPTPQGQNGASESASGTLVDISVLGQSLKQLAKQKAGKDVNVDDFLAPGRTCVISIPGDITGCPLLPALVPTGNLVPDLLTVTISRGTPRLAASPTIQNGSASIVALQVTVTLNCDAVSALQKKLPNLPVAITLALCGGGINPTAFHGDVGTDAAVATAFDDGHHGGVLAASGGQATLVDVQLGVASADLSLGPGDPRISSNGPPPPNTGDNLLILAALCAALLAAGVGIQGWHYPSWRRRHRR